MLETSNYYTEFRWSGKDGYRCTFCPFDSFSKAKIEEHVLRHLADQGVLREQEREARRLAKSKRTAPRQLEETASPPEQPPEVPEPVTATVEEPEPVHIDE